MADTLDTLPAGRWAAIRAVTHSQRQRLLELGFIPGTIVRAVQISPLGDPVAYEVLDAVIALRRCDARCVHITVLYVLHMLKRKRRWNHRLFLFVCGGGCLLPPAGNFLPFVPPAGNFLSAAKESYQRTPAETHGFCTSFPVCKSCGIVPAEAGN